MIKINFKILIVGAGIIVVLLFGFLYSRQKNATPGSNNTGDTNFWAQFNPFGKSGPASNSNNSATDISGNDSLGGADVQGKLVKVSSVPVAGYTVFMKERLKEVQPVPAAPSTTAPSATTPAPTTTTTPTAPLTEFVPALRYVDRVTGNIFQTFADRIAEKKFTTTTFPQVYEAYFGNNAQTVVMRNLKVDGKTIQTFVGNLPQDVLGGDSTESNTISGTFLPENIADVSVSPDTSKLFYLFGNNNGVVGTVYNFSDTKKSLVFDSAYTEWLPDWANGGGISLTTKPSGEVPGYMYNVDLSGGNSFTKILGGIKGLTTLTSPDGNLVLYTDNTLTLSVYNKNSGAVNWLGVRTLPDKCTWNKTSDFIYCAVPKFIDGSLYPDSWYQGEVSFNDQIWKIDATTGSFNNILEPTTVPGGEEIDGTKLSLDDGENYLFFVNKKNSFLWKLNLR